MVKSPYTRVFVICILLIFIAFCGLHLIGAHHDGDTDGLALAGLGVFLVGLALLVCAFAARLPDAPNNTGWRCRLSSDPGVLPIGLVSAHPSLRC